MGCFALHLTVFERKELLVSIAYFLSPVRKTFLMSICVTEMVAVALVLIFPLPKEIALFSNHKALEHHLHKVMKPIFFLGMLAY